MILNKDHVPDALSEIPLMVALNLLKGQLENITEMHSGN